MPDEQTVEPRILRGFRDYLPGQMNARLRLISTIRSVYERYGFQPLDTPALEYRVTLMGYGEENTKQIFDFRNPEDEHVALRFDLTVPLARVIAQYPELPLPFRRYQVGPVWRADKPDPGRFREFTQFDIDSVGTSSLAADAEILCGMYDTLHALEQAEHAEEHHQRPQRPWRRQQEAGQRDREDHLNAMGVKRDRLTPEQKKYLASWEDGNVGKAGVSSR